MVRNPTAYAASGSEQQASLGPLHGGRSLRDMTRGPVRWPKTSGSLIFGSDLEMLSVGGHLHRLAGSGHTPFAPGKLPTQGREGRG